NPHSHIVVRVGAGAADRSTVGTWTVEASAISVMTSSGWTPRTYKPGDPITVVTHPNIDGSNLVLLFYAIMADGTRLYRAAHQYDGEKEMSPLSSCSAMSASNALRSLSTPPQHRPDHHKGFSPPAVANRLSLGKGAGDLCPL